MPRRPPPCCSSRASCRSRGPGSRWPTCNGSRSPAPCARARAWTPARARRPWSRSRGGSSDRRHRPLRAAGVRRADGRRVRLGPRPRPQQLRPGRHAGQPQPGPAEPGGGGLHAADPGRVVRPGVSVPDADAARRAVAALARRRARRAAVRLLRLLAAPRLARERAVLGRARRAPPEPALQPVDRAAPGERVRADGLAVLPAAGAGGRAAGAVRAGGHRRAVLPVLDPHRARRLAGLARPLAVDAVEPPRAPRDQRALPRSQLRRDPGGVGSAVRQLRAGVRALRLRHDGAAGGLGSAARGRRQLRRAVAARHAGARLARQAGRAAARPRMARGVGGGARAGPDPRRSARGSRARRDGDRAVPAVHRLHRRPAVARRRSGPRGARGRRGVARGGAVGDRVGARSPPGAVGRRPCRRIVGPGDTDPAAPGLKPWRATCVRNCPPGPPRPASATRTMLRLELIAISKEYPAVKANDRVGLRVAPGEIHAVLGENGAGKSTLMKIIYGAVRPDAGEIRWEGQPVEIANPAAARKLGIGMVFQHFSLFETLTVGENIALALDEPFDLKVLGKRIREVSAEYGLDIDPQRHVHSLTVGERQRVEIVRCLLQNPRLLIMDEPTSVLTPQAVRKLFETLRRLAAEGCSILYISHKLDEIQELCDTATVMRGGKVTGNVIPREETHASLARLMVGRELPDYTRRAHTPGDMLLEAKHLSMPS